MNEPLGRFGSLRPARVRRIARVDRDPGPVREHFGDDVLVNDVEKLFTGRAPRDAQSSLALEGVALLVGELLGLFEIRPSDGGVLFVANGGELGVDLLVLRRRRHAADAKARTGLVDEVDRLVGQETVRDVAVGEVRGGDERLVGDGHLVVLLVAVAKTSKDLDRVREGRLFDLDRLEASLERSVLF
jgi:hypothetical protein